MPSARIACLVEAASTALRPWTPADTFPALQLAQTFSHRIEEEKHGVVFLDVGGVDERHFSHQLLVQARQKGLVVRIGVGAHKRIAEFAARTARESPRIVPTGAEAAFLKPLPVALLDPSLPMTETLRRWGIRTIGELAALPAKQMITHLGREGWSLHLLARGVETTPFIAQPAAPLFAERIDLEWSLSDASSVTQVAGELLEKLCAQLVKAGLACSELETELRLDPQGQNYFTLKLRAPTQEFRILLPLWRVQLAGHPPRAAVSGLTFTVRPDQPRQTQLSLFGPSVLSPARIAATLLALAALIGTERLGCVHVPDGYAPERLTLGEFDPPPAPVLVEKSSYDLPALIAVRIVRPPLLLRVETSAGRPTQVHSATGTIEGMVRTASGPWRLTLYAEPVPIERAYWDTELSDGGVYRLYEEPGGQWFADGIYD